MWDVNCTCAEGLLLIQQFLNLSGLKMADKDEEKLLTNMLFDELNQSIFKMERGG